MITIVAAVNNRGVIGRDNGLPWSNPEDLEHFKKLTLGKTLVMGRKTFDSIGRPLPGRKTVVLTRDTNWSHPGVEAAQSWDEVFQKVGGEDLIVAGGGAIYEQALEFADRVLLSVIDDWTEGDVYFPGLSDVWELVPVDNLYSTFKLEEYRRVSE